MSDEEIRETELKEWPGWFRISSGSGNRQYRSPGGLIISNRRFAELALKYKGHTYIPESDILPKQHKGFFDKVGSAKTAKAQQEVPVSEKLPNTEAVQMPDATPKSSPRRAGRATAREISDGLYISLSIFTSIVQFLTKTPGLAMTEMESKHIAIPAANLLEPTWINDKFGHMIAGSGDWQLLGYALWLYGERALLLVRETHFSEHARTARGTTTPNISGNGHSGDNSVVSHSWTGNGGITKTPPGIR